MAADVGASFSENVARNRSDGSSELVPICYHRKVKLVINDEVSEQFPDVGVGPVQVVEDVPGLGDQGGVGVAHAQPQTGHHVQQGAKLAGLLELGERFTDTSVREMDLAE